MRGCFEVLSCNHVRGIDTEPRVSRAVSGSRITLSASREAYTARLT